MRATISPVNAPAASRSSRSRVPSAMSRREPRAEIGDAIGDKQGRVRARRGEHELIDYRTN